MSVLLEESKAAIGAGAEWEEEREEMRTQREQGTRAWKATWHMAQGTPDYVQPCFVHSSRT